jgi:hypothetical protein
MPKDADPLASALGDLVPPRSGAKPKIPQLFADRPDVLEGIRQARRRGVSPRSIAQALSSDGIYVSEGAVRGWLNKQGIT